MTLAEFKAWLEGYSASFKDGAPNAEQWAEIKRRMDAAQPISIEQAPAPYVPVNPHPPAEPLRPLRPYVAEPWKPDPNSTGGIPWFHERVIC